MPPLSWRLRWPALPPSKSEPEAIEDGYKMIDVNEKLDPNYHPLEYVVPGPLEEAYQTTRANITGSVSTVRHTYEVYLRDHVEAVSPMVYDAARVAAMIAAIQSMSLFKIVIAGHRIYVRLEDYRSQRQEQLQEVRDRTLQAAHLYRIKDRIEPFPVCNQSEFAGTSSPTSELHVRQSQESLNNALRATLEIEEFSHPSSHQYSSKSVHVGGDRGVDQKELDYAMGHVTETSSNSSDDEDNDWEIISGKDLRQEDHPALMRRVPSEFGKSKSSNKSSAKASATANKSRYIPNKAPTHESSTLQWREEVMTRLFATPPLGTTPTGIDAASQTMVNSLPESLPKMESKSGVAASGAEEDEVIIKGFKPKPEPDNFN
ncbi:hypothetical protein K490DRAFT_66369 [Saccharata proteae CBS 121410]|uniref:Uncharacterized protein n=1 Tax=Saccharata proteae CBS 121410 TaxID=1314787 RepID=A0A9P4HWL4_9PEZI|nr:hypothetical protein K490DRAFT_66369 [Saccharata proteae CBS 121410]